ncbi:DedA family protein [Kitasatospora viridis]|uniref:Membrane protein DedA with SNARE-associated domain n=1 Tax=Kitasatospora viridis TaxID=281105 RepID=A0A561UDQ2_9ACTN|nr:DedA family protein [Kitasatospora viridis]TWF97487.1 membrane protein DedA with SNARE-associated domain [Kitasatospora viridis]
MGSITNWLSGLSGPVVYAVVAALVFAEDALFVGFVLPGETAAVLGGTIAAAHRGVSLPVLMVVVVLAAVLGDTVGYTIGRRFGPALLRTRLAVRHEARIDRARGFIREKGPAAVFFGRFVALFRALVPTLAGVSRMPYGRFLAFNLAGGTLWGIGFTLLGFAAGTAYARVEHLVGTVLAVVVGVLVVAALGVWLWRRHRRERAELDGADGADRNDGADGADRNDGADRADRNDRD